LTSQRIKKFVLEGEEIKHVKHPHYLGFTLYIRNAA